MNQKFLAYLCAALGWSPVRSDVLDCFDNDGKLRERPIRTHAFAWSIAERLATVWDDNKDKDELACEAQNMLQEDIDELTQLVKNFEDWA